MSLQDVVPSKPYESNSPLSTADPLFPVLLQVLCQLRRTFQKGLRAPLLYHISVSSSFSHFPCEVVKASPVEAFLFHPGPQGMTNVWGHCQTAPQPLGQSLWLGWVPNVSIRGLPESSSYMLLVLLLQKSYIYIMGKNSPNKYEKNWLVAMQKKKVGEMMCFCHFTHGGRVCPTGARLFINISKENTRMGIRVCPLKIREKVRNSGNTGCGHMSLFGSKCLWWINKATLYPILASQSLSSFKL